MSKPAPLPPGIIEIPFTTLERELILNSLGLPKPLQNAFLLSPIRDSLLMVRLNLEEAEYLLLALVRQASSSGKGRLGLILMELAKRVGDTRSENAGEASFDDDYDEENDDDMPSLPPEVLAEFEKLCERKFESEEERDAATEEIRQRYNNKPQKELNGLSPVQVDRLLFNEWPGPESPLKLAEDLSFDESGEPLFLYDARIMLNALIEEDGVKATAKGNLNLKFVKRMVDSLRWPTEYDGIFWRLLKRPTEQELPFLQVLHIVSTEAGLMRKYKGKFVITKLGRKMIEPARAGQLYHHLFVTFFQDFNLAFLDRCSMAPEVQDHIIYSFYAVSIRANKHVAMRDLAPRIFLPALGFDEPDDKDDFYEGLILAFSRIIKPLANFGLLGTDESPRIPWEEVRIQKTPLFDRFIQFSFDESTRR